MSGTCGFGIFLNLDEIFNVMLEMDALVNVMTFALMVLVFLIGIVG